jgi:hypothetical protein
MSTQKILNEDWTDYDNKKIIDKRDRRYFSCEETWEVEYLIKYIKKHYPLHADSQIRSAIKVCCNSTNAPRPRREFIDCVVSKL